MSGLINENVFRNFVKFVHRSKFLQIARYLRDVILTLLIFPIALLIRLISPIILIRTGGTMGARIGHFATNIDMYLCEKDHNLHPKRSFDIFFHPLLICNYQVKKMWDRHPDLYINQFAWLLYHGSKILPGSERYEIHTYGCDKKNVFNKSDMHLQFTAEEDAAAKKELKNIGIEAGSTFICIIGRDSEYLKATSSLDYSGHNYRDSNIENYLLAAKELADRGHFVLRMGAHVEKAIKSNDPKIIDYATKGYRTDLLDVYTAAKCHFFIGGNTGLDSLPVAFRRPLVTVNYMPIEFVRGHYSDNLIIFKKHWLKKEKRFMTFREIIESGAGTFYHAELFEQQGIELIENTSEEIRDVTIEMDERIKGTWETTEQDEKLQRQFWSLFKPTELNPHFCCRTGAKYLRQNRDLIG